MTPQEIFDAAVGGLIAQGRPAYYWDDGVHCLYRDEQQQKCAFGQLIPDDVYRSDMENKSAMQVINDTPRLEAMFPGMPQKQLVTALQLAHDNAAMYEGGGIDTPIRETPPSDEEWLELFKRNARNVAAQFHLSAAILD